LSREYEVFYVSNIPSYYGRKVDWKTDIMYNVTGVIIVLSFV